MKKKINKQNGIISMIVLFFILFTGYTLTAQTTQQFTSSGTFVVPAGVTTVQVEAWGGGGAGGGTNSSANRGGGGGAGGSFTRNTSVAVTPGASITVTVGAGGAGVSNGNGGAGGTSTFLGVSAVGGAGGNVGNSTTNYGAGAPTTVGVTLNGGAGSAASSGTSNSGAGGGGSGNTTGGSAASGTTGGAGGTGSFTGGTGGAGLTSGSNDGNDVTGLAAGGGGARGNSSNSSNRSGGNGGGGRVNVIYTCPTYALTAAATATGPFCGASTSVVTLRSSSLSSGTYTVTYNLSGTTTGSGSTTMTFTAGAPGTGTFTTSSLTAGGNTTVTVTGLANAGCSTTGISSNNSVVVTVNAAAAAAAGTAINTCSNSGAVNITAGSSSSNNAGVTWTSNGTGTFTNPNSLTTCTYTPSAADIAAGSRTLTLTATGNSPCSNATSNKTLTINQAPTANAGNAVSTCYNSGAVNITSGASASSQASVTWTSSGSGTFSNANSLTTCTYNPSAADISAGSVTLTLTANPLAGCTNATSQKTLTITSPPAAAGTISGTATVCSSNSLNYSIASVAGATNYTWAVPTGWSINSGQGTTSISVTSGSGGQNGNITVVASNSCASTNPSSTVDINPVNGTNNTGYTTTSTKTSGDIQCNSGSLAGYAKFPLSVIPSGATITGSVLTVVNNGSSSSSATNDIRALGNNDPTTTGASTLYTACLSGTSYSSTSWSNTGSVVLTLNSTATSDIQNRMLSPGYLGVGFDRGGSATFIFHGYAGGANAPKLTVSYTSPRTLAVSVTAAASANSGTAVITCANSGAVNITAGSSASNNTGVTWSSSGTGSFANANSLTTCTYNPSAADIAAGSVNLTLTATANAGCTNAVSSKSFTINPVATVSAGSNQTICSNQSATMNGSFGGGASSATWSTSGTGSFNNNNGNAIYSPSAADKAAGSVVLTYTSNDPAGPCGSVNASMTLTINAVPAITSHPSNVTVCESGNASFSVVATGTGISYQWRRGVNNLSNGGNISGANSATLTITGVLVSDAASDYNCIVSGICDPAVTSADVTLTVNTAPSISSVGNISENTSGSCTVAISNSQLLAQVSSSGSPAPSVTFNPAAGNFNTGTTLVTATAQNLCGSVQTTFNVTVTDNENPSFASCPSNITVNNDAGVCGAHVNWTAPVASDNCSASVSNNYNPGDLFPVGTTIVNYNAVDPSNNSANCSFTVTVIDNEAPVAACQNINVTLNVTGTAAINAIQINNNSTDNCAIDHYTLSQNAFSCVNLGANNVTLTAYDAVGNFSACAATVTVIPYATAAISSNGSVCIGSDASVHVVFNGTAPFNYTISDGSQSVSGSTSNNVEDITIPAPSAGLHTYNVIVFSDAICTGTSTGSANVAVNPVPDVLMVSSIIAPSDACNGTVMQLTANVANSFDFNYIWNTGINLSVVKFSDNINGPFVNGPFETAGNQVYAQFGALVGASGYNVGAQISNACGTSAYFYKWVRGQMGTPGTIAGAAIACSNQAGVNYSVTNTVPTAVYNWTFSVAGATINGQGTNNVSVNFPAFTTGQLCVTAALSCGGSSTSSPRCMTISNTTGLPSVISGPSKVCPGSTNVAYSVSPLAGAVSYNWTVPSGVTIVESAPYSNLIHVNFPANYSGAPPIYVYGVSICGIQSTGRNKTVGSYVPNTPGSITGPVAAICNSTVQYSIANVSGATGYTWTIPSGATNFIGQGTTSIQFTAGSNFTTGYVTVQANTNACSPGTSALRSISVSGAPAVPGNIVINPSAWCVGQTVNASIPTVSPLPTYNWIINNGTIDAGQGSNNVDVITNNAHVIVQVRAINSCGVSGNRTLHTYSAGCREEEVIQSMNSISVAPNPAHNMITVSLGVKQNSDISISMVDISGRTVLTEKLTAAEGVNKYQLNLDHLSKGVYMMQVDFSGDIKMTKIVIE